MILKRWKQIGAAIAVALALIFLFGLVRKKRFKKMFTEKDAVEALKKVAAKHGKEMAKKIEKVARLETAHFASKAYKATGTGGMESHGIAPYYGWGSMFFLRNPSYTPIGTVDFKEGAGVAKNGGRMKTFVIMPSVEAWMMFIADYAIRHQDNGGILRWYSTNKEAQKLYASKLAEISARITNSIA